MSKQTKMKYKVKFVQRVYDSFGQKRGQEWLESELRILDNQKPFDVICTEGGLEKCETLLSQIEHGIFP